MIRLSSILTGYRVAMTSESVVSAFMAEYSAGRGIGHAIDAAAGASEQPIAADVVADIHLAADTAVLWLREGASYASAFATWIEAHGDAIESGAETLVDLAAGLPHLARTIRTLAVNNGAALVKLTVKVGELNR